MARGFQSVQLNELLKEIRIREGVDGRSYILVEDIRDAFFYFGDQFELHGKPVPLLENEHHERLYPERIAAYPDETLTVVPLPQGPISTPPQSMSLTQQVAVIHPPLASRSTIPFLQSDLTRQESLHTLLESQNKKLLTVLGDIQARIDSLQQSAHMSDGRLSEILQTQKNIADTQDKMMTKMDSMIANTEALLTQTYELHEYTLPRLFIVLPEVAYQGINPVNILGRYANVKFRLYFLCECGTHTNPSGPNHINHIHVARHEGYEIKHPSTFFRKYGPHVLRLLHALKLGLTLASGVIPALSTISSIDLPQKLTDDLDLRVSSCIRYLTAFQSTMDPDLSGSKLSDSTASLASIDSPQSTQDTGIDTPNPLDDIIAVEGPDLRRLGTFLEKKDQDRALGNLHRTVDAHGHVKWVCLDHYRSTYHQRQDQEFEKEILQNSGQYDKRLGVVTVVLPSSEAITSFMDAMTRAGSFHELSLHLSNYGYNDLKNLGESLSKTNVSKLTMTAQQSKALSFVYKKKLTPVLDIMAAGKVRYFEFKDIKDFIPPRGVNVPKTMSGVRSLELTGISIKEGHEVLSEMLQAFHHLAVFQLEDTALKQGRLRSVLNGLSACDGLKVLSLRNCEITNESAEDLADFLKTRTRLKELDLSQNDLGDVGCCEVIQAVGGQLTKLSLKDTGFGDEGAMALERVVGGELLRSLDIAGSRKGLGLEAADQLIRLVGRLSCLSLVLPKIQVPSDEYCSKILRALDTRRLEHLELEGNDCGDRTADALVSMFSSLTRPGPVITTLKVDFPMLSLSGAAVFAEALLRECPVTKVSFAGTGLFHEHELDTGMAKTLFKNLCSRLTSLDLRNTGMDDDLVAVLSEGLQESNPQCKLEYLDVSENKLSPDGGSVLLRSLHNNDTLTTLRMVNQSFGELGAMSVAVQQFLETNRTLRRLEVSHVGLGELTLGLLHNDKTLLSLEVQDVDGRFEDIVAFGDFVKSNQNILLRLVVKQARVGDDSRSLEILGHSLKQNQTIVDLEWDFARGRDKKADGQSLRRYLERNRDGWRRSAGANEQDLTLAGIDSRTARTIGREAE